MEDKDLVPASPGETPEYAPGPMGGSFIRNGEVMTKMGKKTIIRRIKLKNRRVMLGYDGEKWAIDFRVLVDMRTRKIMRTYFAVSDEAMSALVALRLSFGMTPEQFTAEGPTEGRNK